MTRGKAIDYPIAPVLEALGAEEVPHVRGSGYRKMRCPFHPDNSPSASVSEFGFRCFPCGITGDAIKLLREQEGLDYQSAVARAAELSGVSGAAVPAAAGGGSGWWSGSLLG